MAESDATTRTDAPAVGALVVVAAAAWSATLVALYVAAHPEISSIVGSAGAIASGASFDGARVIAALAGDAGAIAVAATISLACFGYGRVLSKLVPEAEMPPILVEAAKFALGLGAGAILVFAAGRLGLLVPATAIVLSLGGIACLAVSSRGGALTRGAAAVRAGIARVAADRYAWPALISIAIVVVCVLLSALAPPTARDALTYHLAVPKAYIAAGRIVQDPTMVHSYLPFSTEMLYTWALLLGSTTAPAVVHAIVGGVCVVAIYGVGERLGGSPRWGALAAALVATVPTAAWTAGDAHNETVRSLAMTVAIVAVATWFVSGRAGDVVWTGVGVGLALSAKHTELVLVPCFALVVLLGLRRLSSAERAEVLRPVLAAAAVAVALPLPWYLQNVAWTGDPLFPYFWGLFPTHSAVWTPERATLLENFLRESYGERGIVATLRLPFVVSLFGVDDLPRRFDGVLGPAFLLAAPLVAWAAIRRNVTLVWTIVAAFCGLGFVAWASQSQQMRFLLAIVPAASLAIVAALAAAGLARRVRGALVAGLAAVVLVNVLVVSANVVSEDPFRVAVGLEPRDVYLQRRLGYYDLYGEIARVVPADGRVMLIDARNDTFYLSAPAYSDAVFEDFTIGRVVNDASSADDVFAALRGLGITHMLVRHDILLDPNLTPFLTDASYRRYLDFVKTHTRIVRGDDPYDLLELTP